MKKTAVALGFFLSVASHSSFADEVELQQELNVLKQQLAQLQKRLNQVEVKTKTIQDIDKVDLSNTDIEVETGEEITAVATPATSDDIEGLRSDIENYKYDQSRQYERQTVKSAR